MSIKKFGLTTFALLILFLIYLMPSNHVYNLDNSNQKLEYVNKNIKKHDIFLLDKNNYVSLTNIEVVSTDIESLGKELLNDMIKGNDKIPSGFVGIIPEDTDILSLSYSNNIIKVNFSKDILEIEKVFEEPMIESIIYTLTSIDQVNSIIIYVDNKILTKLPKSSINLPSTLDRKYGINKEYDITKPTSISKATVYYVGQYNNSHYYVPVTKYENSEKEKIDIVIDELTNIKYDSNLMSFINEKAKLVAMNIENDTMKLSFDNYLFDNSETNKVLEEVKYTIAFSALDNYNIKNVVIYAGNQEVYKLKKD